MKPQLITFRKGKSVDVCMFCDKDNAQTKKEIAAGNEPTSAVCNYHQISSNRPKEWQ